MQNEFQFQSKRNFHVKWRDSLIAEIQIMLKNNFNFFITDNSNYSYELKKIIKKISYINFNFFSEILIEKSIKNYCNFLKKFTMPIMKNGNKINYYINLF